MVKIDAHEVREAVPNLGAKIIIVETDACDSGDTLDFDLSEYGCDKLLGIEGYNHGTDFSVITKEEPTTSVDDTTLTITVGGSEDDDEKRVYMIIAK